jgi:uncharacterized repeat protein (TIGR01451 family)
MNPRTCFLSVVLLLPLAPAAGAQMVSLPIKGTSPLLYVRFGGPPGLRTTFFQGRPRGRDFDTPVVVGLRPGYVYRLEVSGLPGRPGLTIYPTLEVRGSLTLPPRLAGASFPAPLVFAEADIDAVLAGVLVTKVVYLEDPDQAAPEATRPDVPLETTLPAQADLLAEARTRGRPMVVVRVGGRVLFSPDELAAESVYGTILFPGEKVLPPASRPPCMVCDTRPFFDPILGPRHPEGECIHDGGDRGERAGLDAAGNLHGLEPEDTVAEFTDSHGRRGLTCSNRVCLCVPRFAVLRKELPLGTYENVVALVEGRRTLVQGQFRLEVPSLEAQKYEQLKALRARLRPSANVGVQGLVPLERVEVLEARVLNLGPIALLGTKAVLTLTEVERARLVRQVELARELSTNVAPQMDVGVVGPAVVGRIEGGPRVVSGEVVTRDITVCCHEVPCPPDKPLVLVKCADRTSAQPGDVVTFFLRYSNHGGKPITDVAVSDSLSPRLEYVPGSAQSDRAAVFTTQPNEAGSVILRWEISGTLQPGQSGALRFQARVR